MRKRAERPVHVRLLQEVVRILQAEPLYRSAARRIRSTERLYSRETDDEAERQLMQVETAKMLLNAAVDKGAAFRTVQRRFRKASSLACDFLPSEVAVYTEFAAYCGRQGRHGAGIRLLERLRTDLKRREGGVPKRLLGYCRAQVAQVLRQLRMG